MDSTLLFIVFVCIFFLWLRSRNLDKRIGGLEDKIRILEKGGSKTAEMEQGVVVHKPEAAAAETGKAPEKLTEKKTPIPPAPEVLPLPEAAFRAVSQGGEALKDSDSVSKKKTQSVSVPPVEHMKVKTSPSAAGTRAGFIPRRLKEAYPELWSKFEKQLVENWTGILGAAILVMGVGFLGIYALLTLSALFRFGMIILVALALFASYVLLRKKDSWMKLARWLRSAGSAVLLFAVIGAGGIPGLKFIDNEGVALVLVIMGIAVNLYSGYAGGTQYFASLHALISLAGMAVVPQSSLTFIIAGIIVFFSIAIAFRSRWEYHLLVTITAFFAYHLYWHYISGYTAELMPVNMRIAGIATTLAVGIIAVFSHYRQIYKTERFETLPFVVHILNWTFLGVGLLFYSTGAKWNSLVLAFATVIIFFLAKHARTLGIRWLYVTDILISQSLALFTVISLSRWGFDTLMISATAYIEIIIFLLIVDREGDWILQKIGMALHHLSLLFLMGWSASIFDPADAPMAVKNSAVILAALLVETAFHLYAVGKNGESFDSPRAYLSREPVGRFSISGFIIPVMALLFWRYTFTYTWAAAVISAICIFLLVVRQLRQSNGIGMGLILLVPLIFIMAWRHILGTEDISKSAVMLYAAPVFLLAAVVIRASFVKTLDRYVKWPGVYLFSISLAVVLYAVLEPVSPMIPGPVWLTVSVIYLEVARFLRRKYALVLTGKGETDRYILHAAYAFIGLFVARYFMVDMQSELTIAGLQVRLMVEIFSVAVFLYWATVKPSAVDLLSWKYLHPLMWEMVLIFSVITLTIETPDVYHSLIWVSMAVFLLVIGNRFGAISRMRLYSVFLFWASMFNVTFLLSVQSVPSENWFDQAWLFGMITLVMQFIFAAALYKYSRLKDITLPAPVKFMESAAVFIVKQRNIVIYYTFSASILYAIYKFFNPVSPFIPGILWLIFSVMFLELARWMEARYGEALMQGDYIDNCLINSGYAFIAAFLIRHFLVHIQSEIHVGVFPVRLMIEIFALAVFTYWALTRKPEREKNYFGWDILHPLFWELIILFSMTVLIMEIPSRYHPLLWISAAIVLLLSGRIFQVKVSRFRFYSLIFHWIALFTIAFVLVSQAVPSTYFLDQVWFWGSAAIALQFLYIMLFHRFGELESLELPVAVAFMKSPISLVSRHRNLIIYYPFFVSIALFIRKSFDETLHTLLWVVESFAIFVVSVILKENHFRYLAMGVLALCLIRLLIYDLARSGTVIKGIVFVCVGLLMLAMNIIYNKYRDRF
ncbi:MAG: hypothetical protein CVV44_05305 [Spirochaetae bacterium HGW-Spirochaetae-1]|jgi:hypothetical protein|nr:MAG: hypothetical protein CVV44_05305 [Spirochaetae bacterium HGW-Spirochaetae-1]